MKLKKKLKIKIFLLFQLIVSPPQLLLIDIYIQDFFFFFTFLVQGGWSHSFLAPCIEPKVQEFHSYWFRIGTQ